MATKKAKDDAPGDLVSRDETYDNRYGDAPAASYTGNESDNARIQAYKDGFQPKPEKGMVVAPAPHTGAYGHPLAGKDPTLPPGSTNDPESPMAAKSTSEGASAPNLGLDAPGTAGAVSEPQPSAGQPAPVQQAVVSGKETAGTPATSPNVVVDGAQP